MKLTISALVLAASVCACSRVPTPAAASMSPAVCPAPAYVDNARIYRDSDAAKTAVQLFHAQWDPKVEAANKAVADAKKLTSKDRPEKIEAATDALAKVQADANQAGQAVDQKILDVEIAAAKKWQAEHGGTVARSAPLAGGQDVSAEIVALMDQGTPEAVAAMKAKDEEIARLKKQLGEGSHRKDP